MLIYSSNLIRYHSESKQKSTSPRDPLCDRTETKAPLISTIASGTISVVIFHSRHKYIFVQLDCENRPLCGGPGSIPGGSGILISVLGLGVCPLSVVCPVLSSAEALTLC